MYDWKLVTDHTTFEGHSKTLHDALDQMVKYAYGKTERDFYVNGHHMNEEFRLWIDGGKVIHDDGGDFVPTNKWYDLLCGADDTLQISERATAQIKQTMDQFDRIFRPQPTRGSAPTNPATLAAKGDL